MRTGISTTDTGLQQFGMARIVDSGQGQGLLVDGGRDQRSSMAFERSPGSGDNAIGCHAAGQRLHLAECR